MRGCVPGGREYASKAAQSAGEAWPRQTVKDYSLWPVLFGSQ